MRSVLAAVLLFGISEAALASEWVKPDFSALTDDQLVHSVKLAENGGLADPCENATPIYAELERRHPGSEPIIRALMMARMFCAEESGHIAAAWDYLRTLEESHQVKGFDVFGLYLASRNDDGAAALRRLRALSKNDELAQAPKEIVYMAIRTIRRADMADELGRFGLKLTKSNGFSLLIRDEQSAFAAPAVRTAAMAGDLPTVERLLPLLNSPSTYIDMLKWREYEKAWPIIERMGGDHLVKVSDDYVAESRARFAEKEAARDNFGDLARALYYGGHFAETEELVGGWRKKQASLDEISEGDAWAMNIEAYALDALGRRGEADAVFDRLAAYDPTKNSWVVNFAINRASRLVGQGRSEEGLAATERAREVAEKQGSAYAKVLVARDRTCALVRLGRPTEAAPELDFLRQNSKENLEAAVQGLLCAHREDEAAALLSRALDDKVLRYQALESFPGPQFELFYTPSDRPQVSEFILARTDLREKALRLVREIPDRFVPEAQLKRKELAGG